HRSCSEPPAGGRPPDGPGRHWVRPDGRSSRRAGRPGRVAGETRLWPQGRLASDARFRRRAGRARLDRVRGPGGLRLAARLKQVGKGPRTSPCIRGVDAVWHRPFSLERTMSEATITLDSREEAILLFGSRDQYLKEIRSALGMQQLVGRGDQVLLKGSDEQLALAERVFGQLRQMLRQQGSLSGEDVKTVLEVVTQGGDRIGPAADRPAEAGSRYLRPRTDGQARYVRAMRDHDMTICVGPAGTGKTYLGVGMAVSLLRQGLVKKIVLVRPAVEAGERLGYLPGDIVAKVNPYLRPLFDALNDMMEPEQVK